LPANRLVKCAYGHNIVVAGSNRRTDLSEKRQKDLPWLARLTHPLVFFGAVIAAYEGTIGAALLVGNRSDTTVLWLCASMAVVILAAMATVAFLVFKMPQHLMLMQQDKLRVEIEIAGRVRAAARLLLESPVPTSPGELLELMTKVEQILAGEVDGSPGETTAK
jgi:hypothetical protein